MPWWDAGQDARARPERDAVLVRGVPVAKGSRVLLRPSRRADAQDLFLTDDAFGSEVARRLADVPVPEGVKVVDYGIRGMHLAYDLLDGYDALVVVDALPGSGSPGDLSVLEVGPGDLGEGIGLSPAVAAAVEPAVELVLEVLHEQLGLAGSPAAERSRVAASVRQTDLSNDR